MTKLIIGLGNPGKEYENTRHNVGFMFADELRARLDAAPFQEQKKFGAMISEGVLPNGEKIILAKPLTFMNSSGEAVSKLLNFYKCPVENLLIAYDDVDLPIGSGRFRPSGGPGTHNGMRSIIQSLGSENFPRIRFGIESRGVSAPKQQDITSFVLTPFSKEEKEKLHSAFQKGLDALFESTPLSAPFSWEG